MPCYRCGTRQVDPDRGSSPWLRGVRADRQVLICPGCQVDGAWVTDLDRCALCASVHLVRRLGEVECRDCGAVGAEASGSAAGPVAGAVTGSVAGAGAGSMAGPGVGPVAAPVAVELTASEISVGDEGAIDDAVPPGLAEEVEQALARVLRWPATRGAGIS